MERNILTFDIEEWSIEKEFGGGRKERYAEFDRLLDSILGILAERNIKATFFCLGKIALDFPGVIMKIDKEGREIGCHSHAHNWANKMTRAEFREDTRNAVYAIEDLIGKKVKSFRAPAFSIGESNKWSFEVLAECGIENDASIFPGKRDFGGFPQFPAQTPCKIIYDGCEINEFPIPIYNLPILNRGIAFSGGGYFRLLPLFMVKEIMKGRDYNMCYFHIADLIHEKSTFMNRKDFEAYFKENASLVRRLSRYMKSNIGRSRAFKNFSELLHDFQFVSVEEYVERNKIENTISL